MIGWHVEVRSSILYSSSVMAVYRYDFQHLYAKLPRMVMDFHQLMTLRAASHQSNIIECKRKSKCGRLFDIYYLLAVWIACAKCEFSALLYGFECPASAHFRVFSPLFRHHEPLDICWDSFFFLFPRSLFFFISISLFIDSANAWKWLMVKILLFLPFRQTIFVLAIYFDGSFFISSCENSVFLYFLINVWWTHTSQTHVRAFDSYLWICLEGCVASILLVVFPFVCFFVFFFARSFFLLPSFSPFVFSLFQSACARSACVIVPMTVCEQACALHFLSFAIKWSTKIFQIYVLMFAQFSCSAVGSVFSSSLPS